MDVFAIIPARGGSKGIPGKNVKDFCGKPLIAWTIEAAKKVSEISKVIVNTDDDEIEATALSYGAEVYKRRKELAGDLTTDIEVFADQLSSLQSQGDLPHMIVDLRATAPLRGPKRIKEGIEILSRLKDSADSVRAVSRAAKHPYKMWNFDGTFMTPFLPETMTKVKEPYNLPRQSLPEVYQNNGAVNAFWPKTVLEKKSMTGDNIAGFVMDDWESINIDTPIDFMIAEALMREHENELG